LEKYNKSATIRLPVKCAHTLVSFIWNVCKSWP